MGSQKSPQPLETLSIEEISDLVEFFDALAKFDFEDQKLAKEAAPSPSGSTASGASQK